MKKTLPPSHPRVSAFGRLLGVMFGVWLLGAVYTPAVAATTRVTVDQQPLTVQPTIPPNVMLMFDDSGSMYWDYMPDWGYMTSSSGNGSPTNDQVRNSAINGVYYNPNITYTPPPKADSTATNPDLYPNSPGLTNAYFDGFNDTSTADEQDITSYQANNNANNSGGSNYPYYTTFRVTVTSPDTVNQTTSYSCPGSAPSGSYVLGAESPPLCYQCPSGYTRLSYGSNPVKCEKPSPSTTKTSFIATIASTSTTTYSCPSGDTSSGSGSSTTCTKSARVNQNYFTYTTGASNTEHYVGTTGTCALLSTASPAVSTSLCDETAATQQNVANWFSYYRTRILMAKSGLMTAFSTVDPNFRVGFASINGSGASWIKNNLSNYQKFSTSTNSSNYLAQVQPFGDGSSGTQKANFWQWAVALSANDSTPLRGALDQVGQYYETSQPWTVMSSDPNYDPNATDQSPIACRQAYTILTTDGFWNDSYTSTTTQGASDTAGPEVDGPNDQKYTYPATSPYSGGDVASTVTRHRDGSTTTTLNPSLADVAMYYWKTDLQSGISNEVPPSTDDPAFWQHMTTFTMGLGFTPSDANGNAIDSTAVFSWANGGTQPSNWGGWPTPASNSINNIADLAHAAVNGHGGFYSATSPQSFSSGLTDALKRAGSRTGTGASLAANSTQLTNGTVAYQAKYVTSLWDGDLIAQAVDSSTGAITTTNWSAVTQLGKSASSGTYPNRDIETYVPPATWTTGTGSFVAFKDSGTTPPSLSSSQLSALGSDATAQANMVNYLRGDDTLEQQLKVGNYRNRTTPLGDIVDSQPVYSGAPNPNEFEGQSFTGISNSASSGDNSFQAFAVGTTDSSGTATASAASTRTPLVFVAANDGMLHAFKASTGDEAYAYLPGAVITAGLSNLSNPDYGSDTVPHQYYNDGELTIADVFLGSAWHTVLVGTTGRGAAKAIYALDITNPDSITPLWERSAGDGGTNANYIGQMVGKPVIAQVADGNWQVLIGNGYNSANGTAALLEFNIADGTLSVHTTDSTAGNGLAAPVAWMDDPSNGISMEAYAGDLQGRVWEFPLDTATTTTSGSTTTTTYTADLATAGTKEFTADSGGTVQPITAGMLAGRDPATGNVWVFFGTGRYLSSGDITSTQVQSWYGLIVQAGKNQPALPALPTDTQSGNLVQRSITYEQDADSTATPPTLGVRTVTTLPTPSDMAGKLGWYMDLEAPTGTDGALVPQGERIVTPSQFQGNLLLGTTRIPEAATNSDICNSSGTGWVMAVDPFTGTNPGASFFQVNGGNGTVTLPSGQVVPVAGVGFTSLPNNPIFVGGDMLMSFDNGTTSNVNTSGASGVPQRVSWQELVNP
ncbi:pilus assembly protein [Rhodanobacter geophilus]|uniref:Pilus assembly protein n=1 Tax=Rhodanobacter geophilus TaxID=3162488 RepID=A0ABV3QMH0_9GAMM